MRYCKIKGKFCEFTTEWGYCIFTVCECLNDFEDFESICYAVEDGDLVRDKNCPLIELPFAEELAEKLYKQIEKAVIEGNET